MAPAQPRFLYRPLGQLRQQMAVLSSAPVLQPGPWCALAPVFANCFLLGGIPGARPGGLHVLPVPPARGAFYYTGGKVRPTIRTLGDLIRSHRVIERVVQAKLPHPLIPCSSSNAEGEFDDLNLLLYNVPLAWTQAAASEAARAGWPAVLPSAPAVPSEAEQIVECMLVSRLGWYLLPAGKPCSIRRLSVKTATALQLRNLRVEQQARKRQFVVLALNNSNSAATRDGVGSVTAAQRKLWKLRWDNRIKEVFWRVVLNGVPTAARMPGVQRACLCGACMPGYDHHYWHCPVAQAVVQSIVENLPTAWCTRTPGSSALSMQHIWLMQPPHGGRSVLTCVWRVVCLAAFNAMDVGRRAANLQHVLNRQHDLVASPAGGPARAPPADQQLITQLLQPATPSAAQLAHNEAVRQHREQQQLQLQQRRQQELDELVQTKKKAAVARFWELLVDFIVIKAAPLTWLDIVPADHPFLRVVEGRLQLAPRRDLASAS